jgi:hypothetical protein
MPEVHAMEKALAHLGEVAGELLAAHRFLQDTFVGVGRDRVDPGEVPQTIADLLASATRTVLVVARPIRVAVGGHTPGRGCRWRRCCSGAWPGQAAG